jgi:hypothetical protein
MVFLYFLAAKIQTILVTSKLLLKKQRCCRDGQHLRGGVDVQLRLFFGEPFFRYADALPHPLLRGVDGDDHLAKN